MIDLKAKFKEVFCCRYELKQECLGEVSPCFYHYTTASDQSNAQTETLKRRKENNLSPGESYFSSLCLTNWSEVITKCLNYYFLLYLYRVQRKFPPIILK